jgi:uncharacterized membrane protein
VVLKEGATVMKLSQMDKEKKDKIQDTYGMVFMIGLGIIPITILISIVIYPVLVDALMILFIIWFVLGSSLLLTLDAVFHPQ